MKTEGHDAVRVPRECRRFNPSGRIPERDSVLRVGSDIGLTEIACREGLSIRAYSDSPNQPSMNLEAPRAF